MGFTDLYKPLESPEKRSDTNTDNLSEYSTDHEIELVFNWIKMSNKLA